MEKGEYARSGIYYFGEKITWVLTTLSLFEYFFQTFQFKQRWELMDFDKIQTNYGLKHALLIIQN